MIMTYIRAGLALLEAGGIVAKLIAAGALVAALAIAYGVWHHKVYHAGYARALSDIAAEDAGAIKRATDMRKTWRSCRDRNGVWDQATGRCGS
ncbi:hypothetical protein FFI89_018715 [Bradyrhizobium sp. KBS0727]|uniref:hypothetical protein n=1 Tax=unclassified Bradyrhizobium TaxID=2631580 RepID=UPI00110DD9C5|nr:MULTISPECIES: hypothetical protein [unclassified Bradyrhizobium]QDW38998.1 hypothetical protein FFI71_018715 [Bradyrhizobium sp. KBS0725]QDW45601.1 hypothetical protein FFI89_018715 [Bradyrhizobium sp. KBS0727]